MTAYRDRVLRLDGTDESSSSLDQMLDAFLRRKKCGGCGQLCEVRTSN